MIRYCLKIKYIFVIHRCIFKVSQQECYSFVLVNPCGIYWLTNTGYYRLQFHQLCVLVYWFNFSCLWCYTISIAVVTTMVTSFLMVHPHSIGLAKEFVQIFSSYVTEKSKWMYWPTQYLVPDLASYFSLLAFEPLQCQDVRCLQDIIHVECINATWN